MNWNKLTSVDQLAQLKEASYQQPILIFKHSTRCSISSMALNRLERSWDDQAVQLTPYLLDLISFREISNQIASDFGVTHQSPQILIIQEGKCQFDASHMDINFKSFAKVLAG